MATHQLAKGLASLGRHGDSMLMHVSPSEVAGLQQLGKMTGHKLHTNPHTGMPEAFDFGSFLSSLLPAAAGFLVGGPAGAGLGLEAGSVGATIAPIAAGMATGAAVAGAKGEDILTGGLMGGLGGYGGGNLGSTFGKMGAQGGFAAGTEASKNLVGPQLTVEGGLSSAGSGQGMATTLANQAASTAAPTTYSQGLSQMGRGIGNLISPNGYDAFKAAGGSGMQLAAPVGMAALSGMQEDMYPEADKSIEEKRKAEENKYRDPKTGLLNLAQASPGLRLMATGGTVGANQSSISTGGIQDLYGTSDQTTGSPVLSKDGYGIGRLENLASQGSNAKAADTFYAMGGPIAFAKGGHQGYLDGAGDGMSDSIPATIEGQQPARLADGEFVIPADVVSHIGNGSSKAGSKQLYAMLDRIRKARTGHTKQGKEIKPHKYMPA
jgi:hypothetical protein